MSRNAALALGKSGDKRAIAALIDALKHEKFRSAAADGLGKSGDKRAARPLIETLRDQRDELNWRLFSSAQAIKALGEVAVVPLIVTLEDRDPWMRWCAAGLLGTTADERAIKPLIRALRDSSEKVRTAAAHALEETISEVFGPIDMSNMGNVRALVFKLASLVGIKRNIRPIITALRDRDNRIRLPVASILEERPFVFDHPSRKKLARFLIGMLKDDDHWLRRLAAGLLGQTYDAHAIKPLIRALKDVDSAVRQKAAASLSHFYREGVRPLIKALKDDDFRVRRQAAKLLGEYGDKRAIQLLNEALEDVDSTVRRNAADALARLQDKPDGG